MLDRMRAEQDRTLAEAWAGRDPDLPLRTPEELLVIVAGLSTVVTEKVEK